MTTDEGNWYVIAETIGGKTVKQLKREMDYAEFVGWCVHLKNQADDAAHRR